MRTKQELTEIIRRERRAVLVVNTHSRRGKLQYAAVRDRLTRAGVTLTAAHAIDRPADQLEPVLRSVIDAGTDLLIAGGGDGTISTAARMLAHRDIALGLMPLGTTNNFARTAGIPLDLDEAVAVLTDGKVIDLDLGLAGETPFTNHVGVGLSADVMLKAPRPLKRLLGRYAYPLTALGLLAGHRPLQVTVRAGGRQHVYDSHQVYVANGGFHAGRPITGDANADDRLLIAYPVGGPTRTRLLRETARNAALGPSRTLHEDPFLAVGELHLETDRPARVEVDGEPAGTTPLRIGLAANALRLMAPTDTVDR